MFNFFGIGGSKSTEKKDPKEESNVENSKGEKKDYQKEEVFLEKKNVWLNIEVDNESGDSSDEEKTQTFTTVVIQEDFFNSSALEKTAKANKELVDRLKRACTTLSCLGGKIVPEDELVRYFGKDYESEYITEINEKEIGRGRLLGENDNFMDYLKSLEKSIECFIPFYEGMDSNLKDVIKDDNARRDTTQEFFQAALGEVVYGEIISGKLDHNKYEEITIAMEKLLNLCQFATVFFRPLNDPLKSHLDKDFMDHDEGIFEMNKSDLKRLDVFSKAICNWNVDTFFKNKRGQSIKKLYPCPEDALSFFKNLIEDKLVLKNILKDGRIAFNYCIRNLVEPENLDINMKIISCYINTIRGVLERNDKFKYFFNSKKFIDNSLDAILGEDYFLNYIYLRPRKIKKKQLLCLGNVLFNTLLWECFLNKAENKSFQLLSKKLSEEDDETQQVLKKLIPENSDDNFLNHSHELIDLPEIIIFFDLLKLSAQEIRNMIFAFSKKVNKEDVKQPSFSIPELNNEQWKTFFERGLRRVPLKDFMQFV